MQLMCVGVTHHHTPVEVRECLNLAPEAVGAALARAPIRAGSFEPIREMVVLSTCNRLEVYGLVSYPDGVEENQAISAGLLLTYLRDGLSLPSGLIEPYLQIYAGSAAAEHLFRVVGGLDSIAIGETQILGQVARALDAGLGMGSARHLLSSLFRAAISAGKRVHAETEIGRRPTNISTLAVELAAGLLGSFANLNILLIGTGKIGGLAVAELRRRGAERVTLINRTFSHSEEIIRQFGGTALPYEAMPAAMAAADLVFTSTTAAAPIIPAEAVAGLMARRPEMPLVFIDLSVPRNVDPAVRDVPNVRVFDMDDIQAFARQSLPASAVDLRQAEAILAEEAQAYEKLLQIVPFIGELHRKVEAIRRSEVERAVRRLGDPGPEVIEQLERMSRALVRKILHEPTMRLRGETNPETLNDFVDTLGKLFDLTDADQERIFPEDGSAAK
jgi:glutamyl-tRNA reductase